jgi:hypothetical protein
MKKDKKFIQAIVVILVVGIGWFHNLDKNSFLYRHIRPVTANWESNNEKSDSLEVKEGSLFTFTKDIIHSGIEHLISNL